MKSAMIFNIERYATEDGKGIRTIVFLKGCALKCKWCANPESQQRFSQIMFKANACIGCGKCMEVCPSSAISYSEGYGYITDDDLCIHCNHCVKYCYQNARETMGTIYNSEELLEILLRDKSYYEMSGGGITFSGGEPLQQDAFICEMTKKLHQYNIHVLVETCGFVSLKKLQNVAPFVDMFFYDIKQMNSAKHEMYTGQSNQLILSNLEWLAANYEGEIVVRYPYIPGHNDELTELISFMEYINDLKKIKEVWFLPYHRLGIPKYQGLGKKYEMGDMKSLRFSDIKFIKELGQKYNFKIRI